MNKQEQTKYLEDYNINANAKSEIEYCSKDNYDKIWDFCTKSQCKFIKNSNVLGHLTYIIETED